MIRAIGMQRVLIILGLIGASVALGFFTFSVAVPQKHKTQDELRNVQSETDTLKNELLSMQSNMDIFEGRRLVFKEMEDRQFFGVQDRAEARDRVNTIQKLSKVINAKYEIRPAVVEPQDVPEEFEFAVIKSDVKITLNAIDDADIYKFIYYMNYAFPGHVTIRDLTIERRQNINDSVLKEIGRGEPPIIVQATMELEWRTMARKEDVDIAPKAEGRGDMQ